MIKKELLLKLSGIFVTMLLSFPMVLTLVSCDTTESLFDHYTPSGEYFINWSELPSINNSEELKLGGFSGLYYGGNRIFYTVTDRGPAIQKTDEDGNSSFLLEENFTPQLVTLELQDDNSIKIINSIPISTPAGMLTTGKIPSESWINDEIFTNQSEDITDTWGIYPGGILFDVTNNFFWVAEQYQPSLLQITVDGKWVKRIRPDEGLRRALAKHTVNGGLTGLDYSTSGDIVAVMGRCLENNVTNDGSAIRYDLRRIILANVKGASDLSMFYSVEPETLDGIPEKFVVLGDITTVNDTSYLVTEYASYNGIERNLLYMVSVNDSTTQALFGLEGIEGKTFETLSDAEWEDNDIKAVNKTLLFDLSLTKIKRPEGIAIIDAEHIAIIDNNNFGVTNGDPVSGKYDLNKNPIYLEIITLPYKLEL